MAIFAVLLACFPLSVSWTNADEPRPLHDLIDEQVAAGWTARQIVPAELCPDHEFLRRASLDLNGVIPTAAAARAFLDDPAPDKRARLVDSLLASPDYARQMQLVFDVLLLERQYGNNVTDEQWREYLRSSFEQNKPYHRLAAELLGADGADEKLRPATRFYMVRTIDSYRVLNPLHITRDVGRLFLGVNLQCAQCHDHPSITDYKQADYQGIRAFVERLYFVAGKQGDAPVMYLAEKPAGDVSFQSVFDPEKKQRQAVPHLPGGAEQPDPTIEMGKEYSVPPADGVLPIPAYSRRAKMVESLASADNRAFCRNAVNRLWELMIGRGLVHPVELHHGGNPPSHPELLELLSARFAASGCDVKWLLREMALSRTYQLASALPEGRPAPPPAAFAVAACKPLRPAQLARALAQATGFTDSERTKFGDKASEQALHAVLTPYLRPFEELYGRPPGTPETGFEASPFQALFLSNGDLVANWLVSRPGSLLDRLSALTEPSALADELFVNVYSRRPTPDETAAVAAYLQGREADRPAALTELAWAMIASTEFRFNH